MRRRGFTLTEILISLGIVGIVASLTAPSLVSQTQNKVNGSKLAATVSLLESAFHNAISTEGVEYLYQTRMFLNAPACVGDGDCSEDNVKRFMGELGKYMPVSSYSYVNFPDIYTENGTNIYRMSSNGGKGSVYIDEDGDTPRNFADGGFFPIFLKNGSTVHIRTFSNVSFNEMRYNFSVNNGSSLYAETINLYIDVNGVEGPNIFGRDIFYFLVGQNGSLYPAGGMDYSVLYHLNPNDTWNDSDSPNACLPEEDVVESGPADLGEGLFCTGRVVDNGYKIDY